MTRTSRVVTAFGTFTIAVGLLALSFSGVARAKKPHRLASLTKPASTAAQKSEPRRVTPKKFLPVAEMGGY